MSHTNPIHAGKENKLAITAKEREGLSTDEVCLFYLYYTINFILLKLILIG